MLRRVVSLILIVYLFSWTLLAQSPAQGTSATSTQAPAASNGFALQDSTPIKLRISRTISSADSRTGDQVDFEVLEEARVNGTLVVAKGGSAIGTVTEAQAKRRMGRGGKLDVNIDYVRLVNGDKAALRAVKEVKGGGHTGAMTAGIVATGLIIWPAAPFFLFMHGKDITIPKGTEITAYVNGETRAGPRTGRRARGRTRHRPARKLRAPLQQLRSMFPQFQPALISRSMANSLAARRRPLSPLREIAKFR